MKKILFCMLMTCVVKSISTKKEGNLPSKDELDQYEKFVENVVKCKKVTSGAITLVKDNKVILSRGIGYANVEKKIPASNRTKFCIGSLTKAFTTTIIAKFLSEHKGVTWDTPLKAVVGSSFQLSDSMRTYHANFKDLLAHKVGVPSNFNALLVGFPENTTREEFVRMLQYQKPSKPFRTEFIYSNYMYTLAAYVLEKVTGVSWEQLVEDYLLIPLNMEETGFVNEEDNFEDFSPSYIHINKKPVAIDQKLVYTVDPCGPAGSVYTTAENMGKWILFHLNNGENANGTKLVPSEYLDEVHKTQMATPFLESNLFKPKHPIGDVSVSYDLGWSKSIYRGYRKIWHAGGIVGYSSLLWLFPDKNAGVFVTISGSKDNINANPIYAIMSAAADLLLGESRWLNDTTACSYPAPWKEVDPVSYADGIGVPDAYWNISLAMKEYTGVFFHPAFGNIVIKEENDTNLILQFGRYGTMNLYPITEEQFHSYFTGPLSYITNSDGNVAPFPIDFIVSENNKVVSLKFPIDMETEKTEFMRNKTKQDFSQLKIVSDKQCDASGTASSIITTYFSFVYITCIIHWIVICK